MIGTSVVDSFGEWALLADAVLDTLPDAVLVTDRDGVICVANKHWSRMVDISSVRTAVELFQALSTSLGLVDANDDFANSLSDPSSTPTLREFAASIRGSERLFQVQTSPVKGAPGLTLSIFSDITERSARAAEELHARKLQLVGQLASGLAHEINTPMQFIGDNLDFIAGALPTVLPSDGGPPSVDDPEWEYLRQEIPAAIEQAQAGVQRVSDLIRAMKTFGHPGDAAPQQPVDLDELIRMTLIVVRNETKYVADVRVDLAIPCPVTCYPGDLGQVLVNLVVNAAHAISDRTGSPSGRGVIALRSLRQGDHVVVMVSDDGGGVPDHVRDRIFEPFFTTKEVGRGTGQGLAIARSIVVERHGGRLTFESNDIGGTTFRVEIPVDGLRGVAA
jgi:signal transduction histidine kinase